MKTRNFPAKKDARRRKAMARAEKAGDQITYMNTAAKVDANARLVRTKKRRVGMSTRI